MDNQGEEPINLRSIIDECSRTWNAYIKVIIQDTEQYRSVFENEDRKTFKDVSNYLDEHVQLLERVRESKRATAEDFNIFYIIGQSMNKPMGFYDMEVILHSPFLVNLLNPEGTHGQGTFFYDNFIDFVPLEDQLAAKKRPVFRDAKSQDYIVVREAGNIDILVHTCKINNNFAVVVENKINAKDLTGQLHKYYNMVKDAYEHVLLIYLKDGTPPSGESMNLEIQKELREKGVLVLMSYKEHIIPWLEKCREIKGNQPRNLDVILCQYITAIKSLFGGDKMDISNEIYDYATENEERLKSAFEIYKIWPIIQKNMVSNFQQEIKDGLNKHLNSEEEIEYIISADSTGGYRIRIYKAQWTKGGEPLMCIVLENMLSQNYIGIYRNEISDLIAKNKPQIDECFSSSQKLNRWLAENGYTLKKEDRWITWKSVGDNFNEILSLKLLLTGKRSSMVEKHLNLLKSITIAASPVIDDAIQKIQNKESAIQS